MAMSLGALAKVSLPAREQQKLSRMARAIPFFPAIPLIPIGLVIGTALAGLVLAIRTQRRLSEIESQLIAIGHEPLHRAPAKVSGP